AASLGASPTRVLMGVTVPLILPALVAGATMSFARALGEFGATLTFAGSLQGTTRTLPLVIYLSRETDTETALALALLLIVVAALLMAVSAGISRRWAADRGCRPTRRRPALPGRGPRRGVRPGPRARSPPGPGRRQRGGQIHRVGAARRPPAPRLRRGAAGRLRGQFTAS